MSEETDAAHRVVMDFYELQQGSLTGFYASWLNLIVTFTSFNFKEIQIFIV